MKKKMVLKKVLKMVCLVLVVAGIVFTSQQAGQKLLAMRSPSCFISSTVSK